jgi:hypothetical protein
MKTGVTRTTPATALDFAEVIAGYRDQIRIHSGENRYDTKASWPLQPPDVPWVVFLQNSNTGFATLAFDFDTSRGDAVADADELAREFTTLDIRYIGIRSGPTDGRHVLVPVKPHVPEDMAAAIARCLKKRHPSLDGSPLTSGRASAIRPPLSPHRNGGRSEPLTDPQDALNVLRRPNDPQALLALLKKAGEPTWTYEYSLTPVPSKTEVATRVSPAIMMLLKTGIKSSGDRTRSGVVWSAVLALVNARFTFGLMNPH